MSKEHSSLADLLRTDKPSLTHERENGTLRIVYEVMARVNQACQEAIRTSFRSTKIEQAQKATGPENAPHLPQHSFLLSAREMVEHKGRQHAIERCLRIRKRIRKPLIKLDADRCSCCLASAAG